MEIVPSAEADEELAADAFIEKWGPDVRDDWAKRYNPETMGLLKSALVAICAHKRIQASVAAKQIQSLSHSA